MVEAKKEDIPKGIPQCLAELIAAQIFNAAEERKIDTLYSIVTTGEVWKFLRLQGLNATIDTQDYFLNQHEKNRRYPSFHATLNAPATLLLSDKPGV